MRILNIQEYTHIHIIVNVTIVYGLVMSSCTMCYIILISIVMDSYSMLNASFRFNVSSTLL